MTDRDTSLGDATNQARIAEENARWDALLETEESQRLLEKRADEALAEIQAGLALADVEARHGLKST